ncbi:MAG TPA: inositol monophosphatase family protein, partial [Polyangiaceae bacterium]
MVQRSEVLEVMIHAALKAGEGLRSDLASPERIEIREKGESDFVSSADLRSQATIRAALAAAYPDHGMLLEEGDDRASTGHARFIVDPLDGTTNFLHAIPHFAVTIALEEEGEIVAGLVLDVAKGEVFWAEKGRGAWLGERRIGVSRETDLSRAIV